MNENTVSPGGRAVGNEPSVAAPPAAAPVAVHADNPLVTLLGADAFAGLAMREKIARLEALLMGYPQAELPVRHHFADGVYVRELPIPATAIIVGKLHRKSHIAMLTKGKVTIVTEDDIKTVAAPYVIFSPVGTKRAFYAHEDSVFATCHATSETDPQKIEAELIAPSYAALAAEGVSP